MTTVNTNNLKNALAKREENAQMQGKAMSFNDHLTGEFKKVFNSIKSMVPKHVTPERLTRTTLTMISRVPKLAECTVPSLVGALMNCASLGLEPNLLGHAYLVPFWNKNIKQHEALFIIGYKGLIDLMRRSGNLSTIYAQEVYECDYFYYEYGYDKDLRHIPFEMLEQKGKIDPEFGKTVKAMFPDGLPKRKGSVIGYYATFTLKDGTKDFVYMSKNDVETYALKYTKNKQDGQLTGVWKSEFDEMAKKTCIRRLSKYVPLSIEIREALEKDDAVVTMNTKNDGLSQEIFNIDYRVTEEPDEPEKTPEPVTPPVQEDMTEAFFKEQG